MGDEGIEEMEDESRIKEDGREEIGRREGRHFEFWRWF